MLTRSLIISKCVEWQPLIQLHGYSHGGPSSANANDLISPSFHTRNGVVDAKNPPFSYWTSLLHPEHGIVFHFAPMKHLVTSDTTSYNVVATHSKNLAELSDLRNFVLFGKNTPIFKIFEVLKQLDGDRDDLSIGNPSAKKQKTSDNEESDSSDNDMHE